MFLINKSMSRKLTTIEFIEASQKAHGNRYDYSKSNYVDAKTKVTVICQDHGEFFILPYAHYRGKHGCRQCGYQSQAMKKVQTTDEIIQQFRECHGDLYDYSLVDYKHSKASVTIICPIHGSFQQNPLSHKNGYGCKRCSKKYGQKSTNQFIRECKSRFPDYDYGEVHYTNNYTAVNIICQEHGLFSISPVDILFKNKSCPSCNPSSNISLKERAWLDSLGVPVRQHSLILAGIRISVDGFDPETNTVYEFWGDFWHGNPSKYALEDINPKNQKTFRELYEATLRKRELLLSNGFRLVEMWESDFISR